MKKIVNKNGITVFQSEIFQTNSTVIETDDCIILVDPTWLPNEVEEIKQYVYSKKGDRPLYLIFTHSDWDHIIGYGAFPDAITIGSQEMADLNGKHEILEQIDRFDQEYYISRNYEIKFPMLEHKIKQNGQIIEIGETKLTFYQAKGHTGDGIFTIVEPLGVFIAGDYLSDVEPPYIYSSSSDYEHTLQNLDRILEKHTITILIPGHGHPTESIGEMKLRQQTGFSYIKSVRTYIEECKSEEESLSLIEHYSFPKGIKPFHIGNMKLMKKEFQDK
jgi:hydroxyacylglutathione hydrolase